MVDVKAGKLTSQNSTIIDNIMLNAFRIAINGSLTQFNMVDGIVDEYEDESGINTASSINEEYNSVNDLYSPTLPPANTVLLLNFDGTDGATATNDASPSAHVMTFNGTAQLDTTVKKFGSAALLLAGDPDTVTTPDSSDWNLFDSTLDDWTLHYWINDTAAGIAISQWEDASNLWEFGNGQGANSALVIRYRTSITGGSPTRINVFGGTLPIDGQMHHIAWIKVGGNIGGYLDGIQVVFGTLNGAHVDTFAAPLVIGDRDDPIQHSYFIGSMDALELTTDNFFSATPVVGLTDTITIPTSATILGALNMTLISTNFTAEAQPDNSRIIIFEEEIDSVTINTDLIAKVSRDGGTTFSTITLVDEGNYETGRRILAGSVNISGQPAGTSMQYKLETENNKNLKIHGTALSWD